MPEGDFILDNVMTEPGGAPVSLTVSCGRIAAIGEAPAASSLPRFDGAGALATPGFSDVHVHLDKAMILGQCPICEGTLAEAVRLTSAAKRGFTAEDVHARASEVLDMAVRAGTQRMRTFVEVDPRVELRAFEAIMRLRAEWSDLIELQVCAFAQEGLTQEPATLDLLIAALEAGADLVGGCPYTDTDPEAHVRAIFDLGERFDVDVDFHADFDLDPEGSILPAIIRETLARGWQGRVAVGHATKFATFAAERREALAREMAAAGIALVVLPATDTFLNGPGGMAPAHRLSQGGVTVALATNNVQNPFTPYGDASLLRMGQFYANLDRLASDAALENVFAMITTAPERIMRRAAAALAVGKPADFLLVEARSPADALRRNAPVRAVVKGGRLRLWSPRAPLARGA
ncbi:cytosine deaminase [Faunimonas pinastri]|uniref:Cytosine deaminase n=1 Tax=Faunimonas pinastri TaxID=1855383 RepID=A0A1H9EQF1_9HYPH|nr:amidohydrolase family protein [Faunimonas pinastri]SEQ27845.1 cytosine deaminase [Faunimonas pinastri]